MRPRCPDCGARLDDDGACPRCELEPVPLEDSDLGIRREDRYVALPPGPRWVPRRVRQESSVGPLVALAAAIGVLGLMVVLAPGDDAPARTAPQTPLLRDATGVVLLRAGPWGVEEIDLDAGTIRSAEPGAPPPAHGTTLDLDESVFLHTERVEVAWATCEAGRCIVVYLDGDEVAEIVEPRAVTVARASTLLAVLAHDGSVLVDSTAATVTPIPPGASPRDVTAWSPDGRWLFVATHEGGIDAIRGDGERFRVPVGARATEWIAIATDASPSVNNHGL